MKIKKSLQKKRGVLKNFAVFTGKHQLESLFDKIADLQVRERLLHSCFLVNIAKFLRKSFFQNTSSGCFCKLMKFYKDIC